MCSVKSLQWKRVSAINRRNPQKISETGIFRTFEIALCLTVSINASIMWYRRPQPAEIVGSNPTGGMDVCCECCVLSGRGLCDELITRPEESYRLWCVVCDLETTKILVNEETKAH